MYNFSPLIELSPRICTLPTSITPNLKCCMHLNSTHRYHKVGIIGLITSVGTKKFRMVSAKMKKKKERSTWNEI